MVRHPIQPGLAVDVAHALGDVGDGENAFTFSFAAFFSMLSDFGMNKL